MFPRLSARQMRWSGWILLAGSIILIVVNYLGLSATPNSTGLPSIPLSIAEIVGGLLIILGLPASYLRQRDQIGRVGQVGFILLWISIILITIVLSIYAIIYTATTPPPAHPGRIVQLPIAFRYLSAFGLLQLIGTFLYGVYTYRVRIFPIAAGLLMLLAVLVALPQLILSGIVFQLLALLSTFLLLISFAVLG